jgi:hypothetical protein
MGGTMRNRSFVWICLFLFGAVCSAAQGGAGATVPGEQFVGTWTGTWDASGSGGGGFEVTLEKGTDAMAGRVSVTGEPTYKATFKAVSFDGNKMTAKYDFPPAEGAEAVLTAVFEGSRATGKWSLREKASDNEVAAGGWSVTKK